MDCVPVDRDGNAAVSTFPVPFLEEKPVPLTASTTPGVFTDLDSGRHYLEIDQHLDGAGILHMYREVGSDRTFFALEAVKPPEPVAP